MIKWLKGLLSTPTKSIGEVVYMHNPDEEYPYRIYMNGTIVNFDGNALQHHIEQLQKLLNEEKETK